MSDQDNIRVAEEWIRALSRYDADRMHELRAPGYILEHPGYPGPIDGEEEEHHIRRLSEAFPDWHWETAQIVSQGDYVVRNGVRRGTHLGPMTEETGATIAPSGKELVLRISNTLQIKDGKVFRSFVYYDRLSLLKQLGLIVPGL
jgi:predicted ester cyclase